MLNLPFDINIEVKKITMPIYFDGKNECVNCCAKNSLVFVDKFGNYHNDEIKAFDHIKCRKCGYIYSIKWNKDPKDPTRMYPSAIDPSISRDFQNIIDHDVKMYGSKEFIN